MKRRVWKRRGEWLDERRCCMREEKYEWRSKTGTHVNGRVSGEEVTRENEMTINEKKKKKNEKQQGHQDRCVCESAWRQQQQQQRFISPSFSVFVVVSHFSPDSFHSTFISPGSACHESWDERNNCSTSWMKLPAGVHSEKKPAGKVLPNVSKWKKNTREIEKRGERTVTGRPFPAFSYANGNFIPASGLHSWYLIFSSFFS